MKLMILIAVLIYWILPVDVMPGPVDDIIITFAGAVVAMAEQKKVNHAND